ncbi:hypothetical protein [Wolbachia endosymbiont of Cardiocondyla obscurior]|nr:hypothetical protein [Wolbachia endosymbiont of Cardiocondyla obscurior]
MANKVLGVEGDIDEEKTKFSGKISRIFLGSVHDGEGTAKWLY